MKCKMVTLYDASGRAVTVPVLIGADGITPHIGDNGNWWIGDTDTGVQAQGDAALGLITPQMYGAVGDGVTDDTDAFTAALEENDSVYIPSGTYAISSGLDLTAGKRLYSDAAQKAILRYTGTSGDIIRIGRYSKFQNVDIHIPNVLSGNVFNTDNRLYGTGASFLYSMVGGCDIMIDNECSDLTLININASNDDGCQGFCYQTYRDINALAPDYVGDYAHSRWGRYSAGIKVTLSADKADTSQLSWITHLNFENIFLGSPVIAVKTGIVNNSGVTSPTPTALIDQMMMTNVSAQIAVGYSEKYYDIDWCSIRAVNCIAWDYAAYIEKYNTFGGNAHVLLQHGELPPVDATEFTGETFADDSQYWDDFPYFINKYFSQLPTLTTGLNVSGRNDPRYATKITSVTDGANIDEIASSGGGGRTPEVITPSVYRISGRINVGTAEEPVERQGVGIQINAGTYWGWNGTASKRIMFTTSGECYMSQYTGGTATWSVWIKIFTENNLSEIFDGITDSVNTLIDNALDEAESSGRFSGNYELTDDDKAEIADMVQNTEIIAQSPLFVDSTEKMTDTERVYVLTETGHIWAYMDTTTEEESVITDAVVGTSDNPYQVGRLASDGTLSADVTGYVLTPYIDLTKAEYVGKEIKLYLGGLDYANDSYAQYVQSALYKADKSVISGRMYTSTDPNYGILSSIANMSVELDATYNGKTYDIFTITIPASYNGSEIGYMRFCAAGAEADSDIFITYKDTQVISGYQWVDTGMVYAVPQ